MSTLHCSLLSLGSACGFALPSESTLTALRALRIAKRRLRPEVRSKLLSISSARTDSTFVPKIWRFVFLDQTTTSRQRVVTVAAKTSSEHPDTVEALSGIKEEQGTPLQAVAQNKLLFDSDKALEQARRISKLKGIKSAEYRLLQTRDDPEPLWQLSFYAEALESIAGFQVGASTGVIQTSGD